MFTGYAPDMYLYQLALFLCLCSGIERAVAAGQGVPVIVLTGMVLVVLGQKG